MVFFRNLVGIIHLLRGHAGNIASALVGLQKDLVGDHVQLLLRLALDIFRFQAAHGSYQCTLVDGGRNFLAGNHDVVQQQGELAGGAADFSLLLDQELGDGGAVHV